MKVTAPLLVVAALPATAHAIGLGDATLRSPMGQPLDARIALVTQGESITSDCFTVVSPAASGLPSTDGIDLAVERTGSRLELHVRTRQPVREPYVAFTIRAACPGQNAGTLEKTYALLPDPPAAQLPVVALPARVNPEPAAPQPGRDSVRQHEPARAAAAGRRSGGPAFTLRLSTSTATASGTARAGWRERQRDIEADDRTAEILQLKRTVELLDARVASLQLKLAQATQLQAPPAPPPPPIAAMPAAAPSEARWILPMLLATLLGAAAGYLGARRAARRDDAARDPAPVPVPAANALHRAFGVETGQWVAPPLKPLPPRLGRHDAAATAGRPPGSRASTAAAR